MAVNRTLMFSSLLTLSLFFLGGCKEEKTQAWYMTHHDALIEDYTRCLKHHADSRERCIPVMQAKDRLMDDPDVAARLKKAHAEYVQRQAPRN